MQIELTKGFIAEIDDADWPLVCGFTWCVSNQSGKWYAVARRPGSKKQARMHRVILGITDPKVFVDHHDGDTLNNRRGNLRPCTHSQNLANQGLSKKNTSGYKGAYFNPVTKRWKAIIGHEGRHHHLGFFATAIEAALAYDRAARATKGEFAVCNFPEEPSAILLHGLAVRPRCQPSVT